MEIIKKKILIESFKSRASGINYGLITASTINFNIFLKQKIKDNGLFTDVPFSTDDLVIPYNINGTPNINNPLVSDLLASGYSFDFMTSTAQPTYSAASDYYYFNNTNVTDERISAFTSSRIDLLQTNIALTPYIQGLDFYQNEYYDYQGTQVEGVSQIFDLNTISYTGYCFDANDDSNIGTTNQTTGILMRDFDEFIGGFDYDINYEVVARKASISYNPQGWNMLNSVLSGIVKDETYLGVVEIPRIESDVFIERGEASIFEPHFRLSEVESLEHLENYGNGYYNIRQQNL